MHSVNVDYYRALTMLLSNVECLLLWIFQCCVRDFPHRIVIVSHQHHSMMPDNDESEMKTWFSSLSYRLSDAAKNIRGKTFVIKTRNFHLFHVFPNLAWRCTCEVRRRFTPLYDIIYEHEEDYRMCVAVAMLSEEEEKVARNANVNSLLRCFGFSWLRFTTLAHSEFFNGIWRGTTVASILILDERLKCQKHVSEFLSFTYANIIAMLRKLSYSSRGTWSIRINLTFSIFNIDRFDKFFFAICIVRSRLSSVTSESLFV